MRIGYGEDIHALVDGRELWLGGVKIPFERGLDGHSDADALLHAVMDALLGALALDDIGKLFPNTDPAYRGISSMKLLEHVMRLVCARGRRVSNLDTVILCEHPKIGPHRAAMRASIASALGIDIDAVSIKAGTNEGFDAVGRGQAIQCKAIVLLEAV
ncbi:MAG: 2-C-methyl-D-erythritol 2,4-cyclodiphosphate synthase [Candidatus Riflebacteria bacterium]|nr:2-C-methyl-D-erythritol 2,4-cyclodiphosphate synthase [Candidatus Riflebacteria bacterium]